MHAGLAFAFLASLTQPPRLASFNSDSQLSGYLRVLVAARTRATTCGAKVTTSVDSVMAAPPDSVGLVGGFVRDMDGNPAPGTQIQIAGLGRRLTPG